MGQPYYLRLCWLQLHEGVCNVVLDTNRKQKAYKYKQAGNLNARAEDSANIGIFLLPVNIPQVII